MSDHTTYPLRMVTPEGVAFDGDVELFTVTGTGGNAGFYAQHAPLVAQLRMGTVKATLADGTERTWATLGGYANVHDSTGLVVVDDAEDLAELDEVELRTRVEAAKSALETARQSQSEEEVFSAGVRRAEAELAWVEHLNSLAGAQS